MPKFPAAVALTESETEYGVSCIKHVFAGHVVLQFNLSNTLNDQKLENVRVVLEGGDQDFEKGDVVTVPCPGSCSFDNESAFRDYLTELVYGKPGVAYVAMPLDPFVGLHTKL